MKKPAPTGPAFYDSRLYCATPLVDRLAPPHQRVNVKFENARGVEPENFRALFLIR